MHHINFKKTEINDLIEKRQRNSLEKKKLMRELNDDELSSEEKKVL